MRKFIHWLLYRHDVRHRLISVTWHKPDYRKAWLNAND